MKQFKIMKNLFQMLKTFFRAMFYFSAIILFLDIVYMFYYYQQNINNKQALWGLLPFMIIAPVALIVFIISSIAIARKN